MTNEQAKSELMQIYMSLSEEKKQALDVLMAQADGEYISRNNAITSICQWGTTLERTGTYTITIAEMKQTIADMLCELPSVAIPSAEPCEDAISRQAVLDAFGFSEKTRKWGGDHSGYNTMMLYEIQDMIESAPSVISHEPTGHCEDCKHFHKLPYHADALGKCIHHGGFCPKGDWYCADFEPQETKQPEISSYYGLKSYVRERSE